MDSPFGDEGTLPSGKRKKLDFGNRNLEVIWNMSTHALGIYISPGCLYKVLALEKHESHGI